MLKKKVRMNKLVLQMVEVAVYPNYVIRIISIFEYQCDLTCIDYFFNLKLFPLTI